MICRTCIKGPLPREGHQLQTTGMNKCYLNIQILYFNIDIYDKENILWRILLDILGLYLFDIKAFVDSG